MSELSARAAAEDPDNFTTFHIERIRGVSDVICSDALPGELPTITCKYTVRYWSSNAYQVARLIKKDGIWEIDQALTVTRKRR